MTSTRTLKLGCTMTYTSTMPVATVAQVRPRLDDGVPEDEAVSLSDESWSMIPELPVTDYRDLYGNHCRRFVIPQGTTSWTYAALATVPDAVDAADPDAEEVAPGDLPDDALVYTLPSRFCESDRLGNVASKLFGSRPRGYQRVADICEWTWSYLTYAHGSSHSATSAYDVYGSGRGVCRDFAHLLVAMCRSLNIPARYAAGYLPDMDVEPLPTAMDFHAWTEVFLGGRWWAFDARHNERRKGRVKIGHGRDAADLASTTTYGAPFLSQFTVVCEEVVAPHA